MANASTYDQYELTVGIECHVQLATVTKLFSASDNDARDKLPNTVVNQIDFGLPGMLPVLNTHAVTLAVKAGLALGSRIAPISRFDRKHYFYPDLPKGYQISQLYQPIIEAGIVTVPLDNGEEAVVRIHHAHLEEDAGKLTHHAGYSLVDLNRAGTPLIEIVSEPDIHSAKLAKAYAQELYLLMVYAGVTHGDLYHGNMRFDVNISVAKKGANNLGNRTETKNLNSFRSVERVVEYEFKRQVDLCEKGEKVVQETRGWDEAKQATYSQRSKEDAHDYRYMPDPDIPPVAIDDAIIQSIAEHMPKMPSEYRQKWHNLGLDASVIGALLARQEVAGTVYTVQQEAGDEAAKRVANWYASAVDSEIETNENQTTIDPSRLIELADMVANAELNSTAAKEIFNELLKGSNLTARDIAEDKNLLQVSDEAAIIEIVEQVLADPASQKAIADIKTGNDKAIGYLVGQVMKLSQGKANPSMAQKLLRTQL
jgi:aspartyl-tRNA(Asn)/glutamyl-tRNA(Gln) amidotransferase subunit B